MKDYHLVLNLSIKLHSKLSSTYYIKQLDLILPNPSSKFYLGYVLYFINQFKKIKEVSTTVRVAPSNSTTIAVAATQGIPGGSTAVFNGFKVNNSSTNNVNSVTPDPSGGDSDGAITCDVAQTLFAGTKLTFKAANKNHFLTTEAAIKINLAVLKFPLIFKKTFLIVVFKALV